MVLRNGQLMFGYFFWQKEEDQRKGSNIARTLLFRQLTWLFDRNEQIQAHFSSTRVGRKLSLNCLFGGWKNN